MTIMKFMDLKHKNLTKLLEVVDQCEGNVELVGPDLRLNLKSKLTQFLSLAQIFNAEDAVIKELEIIADNPRDVERFVDFMMTVD